MLPLAAVIRQRGACAVFTRDSKHAARRIGTMCRNAQSHLATAAPPHQRGQRRQGIDVGFRDGLRFAGEERSTTDG
jgi:hypothetical protein